MLPGELGEGVGAFIGMRRRDLCVYEIEEEGLVCVYENEKEGLVRCRGNEEEGRVHAHSPALLSEEPGHLLPAGAACASAQLLPLLVRAEGLAVAQPPGPGHVRQGGVIPGPAPAGSARPLGPAPAPVPAGGAGGRGGAAGLRVQGALGGADGGGAVGEEGPWGREGVPAALGGRAARGGQGLGVRRAVPLGPSGAGGGGEGQLLRRLGRGLRLGFLQGEVAAFHASLAASVHRAAI